MFTKYTKLNALITKSILNNKYVPLFVGDHYEHLVSSNLAQKFITEKFGNITTRQWVSNLTIKRKRNVSQMLMLLDDDSNDHIIKQLEDVLNLVDGVRVYKEGNVYRVRKDDSPLFSTAPMGSISGGYRMLLTIVASRAFDLQKYKDRLSANKTKESKLARRKLTAKAQLPPIKVKQAEFIDELADLLAEYGASIKVDGGDMKLVVKGRVLEHNGMRKISNARYDHSVPTISARTLRKYRNAVKIK